MNITYDEKIKKTPQLFNLVQQATQQLQDVLKRTVLRVTAEWEQATDERGGDRVKLHLSDGIEKMTTEYSPDELRQLPEIHQRFHRLWSNLLEASSHKQLVALSKWFYSTEGTRDAGQDPR